MGKLVISEEVTAIASLACGTVNEIWIPATVIGWDNSALTDCSATIIRLFCEVTELPAQTDAAAPIEFILP